MELFKTKTTWLGIVCIAGAVVKTRWPEYATMISLTPDVLLITGLGLIFGRDAINKIGKA